MQKSLPDAHEPLVLADGRVVDPATGRVSRVKETMVEVPRTNDLRVRYAAIQRRLQDLPLPIDKMHGISVILTYKMFGLSNEDIAVAVGISESQVANIIMSDAYIKLHGTVVENIKSSDMDDIRAAIHENARKSVLVAEEILNDGSEGAKVAIVKDMLDRGGFRPVDVVEHRHKMEGGLRVEIIRKRDDVDTAIDVDFKEIKE